ncbi:MAG TPA: hypothetical protein PKA76_19205 [Pirellulaceae bacterium]|nr:hypothetical protein [Pirellulaceae bacterium]
MKPTITVEIKRANTFRFVWLKYVRGFNPNVHCARCLIGEYSKLIRRNNGAYYPAGNLVTARQLDEQEAPFIYLCGVTPRWAWNVHIAGVNEPGLRVFHEDDRIKVEIENFRQLAIDATMSPPADKDFATCRNWQFGWCAFPETQRRPDLLGGVAWME